MSRLNRSSLLLLILFSSSTCSDNNSSAEASGSGTPVADDASATVAEDASGNPAEDASENAAAQASSSENASEDIPPDAVPDTEQPGCQDDSECPDGQVCGLNNGTHFGRARAENVCWPAECELDLDCGEADSPCGQECLDVTPCDDGGDVCPEGEVCIPGLGASFGLIADDACAHPACSTNEGIFANCGFSISLCGYCVCMGDCSSATCGDPMDGCGGHCTGVCEAGESGCTLSIHCPIGYGCSANGDGTGTCRPDDCFYTPLEPPLCGAADAPCGEGCPECPGQCEGRECGEDPNCSMEPDLCGTCPEGEYCNIFGQCDPATP